MSDDLIKRLEITGQMISLGERIGWGVDSALMAEAAAALAAKDAEIARLREALSLIAVMGFDRDDKVARRIGELAVEQARAARGPA